MQRSAQKLPVALLTLALLAGVSGFASVGQAQEVSLEKQFLEAEAEKNREKSIEIWKTILQRPDLAEQAKSNPIYAEFRIKATIIEDYLNLYREEQDIDHLQKAKAYIFEAFTEPTDKAWAYTYMLAQLPSLEGFSGSKGLQALAQDFLDQSLLAIKAVNNPTVQQRLNYAVALTLTKQVDDKAVFDAESQKLVHGLALDLSNPAHRFQIMRRLAKTGAYPALYAPLYAALQNMDAKAKDFIDIHTQALADDRFDLALTSLVVIKEKDERTEALIKFFEDTFAKNDISRARRIAEKIDNPAKAVDAWSTLGGHYLIQGYSEESKAAYSKADEFVQAITKEESREKALKLIADRKARDQKKAEKKSELISEADQKLAKQALQAFETEGIVKATEITRQISDVIFRVKTLRQIAEQQTLINDKFGLLEEHPEGQEPKWYTVKGKSDVPEALPQDALKSLNDTVLSKTNDDPKGTMVLETPASPLGHKIPYDPLVKRLKANGDTVRSMVPLPGDAYVLRSYYENNTFNSKFYEVAGNASFSLHQKSAAPEAIVIERGVTDIPALYDWLRDSGYDDYIQREGQTYLLRRPLVIGPRASLVVTGDDVAALRMSTNAGVYIVVVGKLYFSDSKLIGWSEDKAEPTWAEYKDKRQFRPYVTAWSQSAMYIGNSELIALGYGNGKSYGLSFSAGPSVWFKYGNDMHKQRPTGIVADSSFNNTLYGFYSYEADDVVLSGNEYIDNIVYGIDPHDRSHRLAIGYNTAYATHKKHGIIISREVNDSIIFGNVTFENKGTGIMLDRDSNGTLVYGNTSFHNHQDGLTLFESDCEIVASNLIFENNGSGFRIRNSYNIGLFYNDLKHNKAAGISAYDGTLFGDDAHKLRDFDLDPYDELTAVSAVGNRIEANNTGFAVQMIEGLHLKQNEFINQSPKIIRGEMFKDNEEVLFRYDQKGNGVSVLASCPAMPEPLFVQACKYRQDGTLSGDGLDNLVERIAKSKCAKSLTETKKTIYSEGDHEDEE